MSATRVHLIVHLLVGGQVVRWWLSHMQSSHKYGATGTYTVRFRGPLVGALGSIPSLKWLAIEVASRVGWFDSNPHHLSQMNSDFNSQGRRDNRQLFGLFKLRLKDFQASHRAGFFYALGQKLSYRIADYLTAFLSVSAGYQFFSVSISHVASVTDNRRWKLIAMGTTTKPAKVRQLLTEQTWTQHAYARDKDGKPCLADSPFACQWCVLGAVQVCYPDSLVRQEAIRNLKRVVGNRRIANVNDAASWADIQRLIHLAGV